MRRLGLDLRSLALLRVLLGLLLLVDLGGRLGDLRAFYSDPGVLPRAALLDGVATASTPWQLSLHGTSGLWQVQLVLFALAALCALALLLGFRTRLATVLSWFLLLSLHNRNPTILDAGDGLLRMLLFWSMFLPLGARASVDRALAPEPAAGRSAPSLCSAAAFCLLVQITVVPVFTTLLERHPIWTEERSAVWHALKLDSMTLPVGEWLLSLPTSALEFATAAVLAIGYLVPLLIWIPFRVGLLRTVAVVVMVGLHVILAFTLRIGLFPWVCCAMWLALLPAGFWNRLFTRLRGDPRRTGLTLYYDADCGFCRRMVLVMRELLLLPETRILEAQCEAEIEADMRRLNSWVVVDHQQRRLYEFDGVVYVLRRSPWVWPLGALLAWGPQRWLGKRAYRWVADHRPLMGRLTRWMVPARPGSAQLPTPLRWARNGFLLATLAYVLVWNAHSLHRGEAFAGDSRAGRITAACASWLHGQDGGGRQRDRRGYGRLLRIAQPWSLLAPHPPLTTGWFVAIGTLEDGSRVDLYRHVVLGEAGSPVSFDRPERCIDRYRGPRWRRYMLRLRRAEEMDQRPLLCEYLAREWRREHGGGPRLQRVELYFIGERIRAYLPNRTLEPERLWTYAP